LAYGENAADQKGLEEEMAASIRQADQGGISDADLAHLQSMVRTAALGAREKAARKEWARIKELFQGKNWRSLKKSLAAFKEIYQETRTAQAKQKEWASLNEQAMAGILSSGFYYDFKNPESFKRFKKDWEYTAQKGADTTDAPLVADGVLRVPLKKGGNRAEQKWTLKNVQWKGDWEFHCDFRVDVPTGYAHDQSLILSFGEQGKKLPKRFVLRLDHQFKGIGGYQYLTQFGSNLEKSKKVSFRDNKELAFQFQMVNKGDQLAMRLDGQELGSSVLPEKHRTFRSGSTVTLEFAAASGHPLLADAAIELRKLYFGRILKY